MENITPIAQTGWRGTWNRVYDSTVGRYLQPDPVDVRVLRGGPAFRVSDPYTYSLAAPLEFADFDARFTIENDFSSRCKQCKKKSSDWNEGVALARRLALNPACSDSFRKFKNASLFNLLAEGTPPRVVLGAGGGAGHYYPAFNYMNISCQVMFDSSPEEVARTLIHELAHYANDAASRFGGKQSTWPWHEKKKKGEGYDAEEACFGSR